MRGGECSQTKLATITDERILKAINRQIQRVCLCLRQRNNSKNQLNELGYFDGAYWLIFVDTRLLYSWK